MVPEERKIYLTNKPNHSEQRPSTTRTQRSAEHPRPTATAPDVDTTDPPRSLPSSRRQPVQPAQELPPSITDPATLERAAARAEHVRAVVDLFPPLTPEQRDRIAVLLRPDNRGGDLT
jgi:hypothetical protein